MIAYYFGWPHGQIWPNLIASAICTGLMWWRLHRQAVVHHVRQAAQAAKHHVERLDQAEQHHAEMKRALAAHCADIKEHVTAAAAGQPVTVHVTAQGAKPDEVAREIAAQVKRRGRGDRM